MNGNEAEVPLFEQKDGVVGLDPIPPVDERTEDHLARDSSVGLRLGVKSSAGRWDTDLLETAPVDRVLSKSLEDHTEDVAVQRKSQCGIETTTSELSAFDAM